MTNDSPTFSRRPDYVGPQWLRCTRGYAFVQAPPTSLQSDKYLASENLWERMVCITLQAQAGDFRNVEALLALVNTNDAHLRDCAVRVFAQSAPSSKIGRLAELFEHADVDVRMEAYAGAVLSCDLGLTEILAERRARTRKLERDTVMDQLSYILEPNVEDLELVDSPLDDDAYRTKVAEIVSDLRARHPGITAVHRGAPVDLQQVVAEIAERCADEDPDQHGGTLDQLFALLEGMTGTEYAGCLDEDCVPALPQIAYTINRLKTSGRLATLRPGHRYFFGHPID